MNSEKPDFDVGIIGGGPAGSAMAAYLAKAGVSCVIFERELFPRPHVGESLVPSSTRVFKDLDFLPTMEEAKFPHKFGAAWTASEKSQAYSHDFAGMAADSYVDIRFEEREQPGIDKRRYTYHVDRAKFDLLLLQHAHKFGAHVYEGVDVKRIDNSDPHLATIHYSIGRKEMSTSVRMIVDCSGRKTLVGNQMKWRIRDKVFDQYAIHSWFEGLNREAASRDKVKSDYIYIHFLPIKNSWIWQIPITDTITSVGVVTQKSNFPKGLNDREKFFWNSLESRPELLQALRSSDQLRPLTDEGDYSYAMTKITDDRIMLVGDAARFVDPIFSTGVSIALNGARFGHRDILQAMETGDFSRKSFANYETTMRRGTKNWYEFINVYYRLNVLFTAFILDKRYRLDVIKLLQGDVYDEDEPVALAKMRETVSEVEKDKDHPWHALLGDLTANAFTPNF